LFTSCNKLQNAGISGTIANAPDGKVILEDLSTQAVKAVDTADVKGGAFAFDYKASTMRIGRVRFSDNKSFMMVMEPNGKVNITGDLTSPTKLVFAGSNASQVYTNFLDKMNTGPDQTFAKAFIDTVSNPLVALLTVNYLNPEQNYPTYQKVSDKLQKELSGSDYAQQMSAQVLQMKAQADMSSGKPAPEIELPTPDGKILKLSALKGKVVLIDFWASWCRPCRMENPNVVKAYAQYKDKGFTVYSVSLDSDKTKWVDAIKQDGLTWTNHVSELKGWNGEKSKEYGVSSIPRTFLLDKEGNIVASNLRGEQLEAKLAELLN
jgi:peroxiredoxin